MTRILFIGETWQGSSARSLREGLALQPNVVISDIGEDHFLPNYRQLPLRIANRLLHSLQLRELETAVLRAMSGFPLDAVVVYKGAGIGAGLLEQIRSSGIPVINVFPDYSPHAYGRQLQEAIGCYDLVISTKPFHPRLWRSVYGYRNPCVCVPHGYDPEVHYWADPSPSQAYDVVLCSTWRPEYHRLMRSFADAMGDDRISVAIAGSGWPAHRISSPGIGTMSGSRWGGPMASFCARPRLQ